MTDGQIVTGWLRDEGPLGRAYRRIKRKRLLHLALLLHDVEHLAHELPVAADLFSGIASLVFNAVAGIIAGGLLVGAQHLVKLLKPGKA